MVFLPSQSLILIVDPYSTGCMVAQEISKRGYPIMAIWVSCVLVLPVADMLELSSLLSRWVYMDRFNLFYLFLSLMQFILF